MRTIPVYELREDTPGGPTGFEAKKILIAIDIAEKKIVAGQQHQTDIEDTVRLAAGGGIGVWRVI
jgi:hypothetical protein